MDGELISDEHHVVKYLAPSKWNEQRSRLERFIATSCGLR